MCVSIASLTRLIILSKSELALSSYLSGAFASTILFNYYELNLVMISKVPKAGKKDLVRFASLA